MTTDLRTALLLAYIGGLLADDRTAQPPLAVPAPRIPLDDTGRAPIVPLRPVGGVRG